jgi:outer membrane protein assembly factor BamA
VDIAFRIRKPKSMRDVIVEGNDKTSENMILSQLEVKPGDPVSLRKLGNSRRNLYRTGAYSLIDILREPAEGSGGADAETPVRLRVKVREVQPFQFRYGAYFDTERGPGVILDFSNRNRSAVRVCWG